MRTILPSSNKRFKAIIGIRAHRPVEVGIVAYCPDRQASVYLKRKARLGKGAYREITAPFPVSPSRLALEIYNKDSLGDDGFEVEKLEAHEMPPPATWASPERHRFMGFAIGFAQKAGYLPPGHYHSRGYEFLIQYLPAITDVFGNELVTPARIHREMPRVQLSQNMFRAFPVPVRVAILAHEGCHYFLNTRSEKEADLCGLKYYLDYGFPKIEAIYAATKVFGQHPGAIGRQHVGRTKDIMSFIDSYKETEGKQTVGTTLK